jgi:hypothetical protein
VKTLKVDPQKRIRIPDATPGQVFAYENKGNGLLTLTVVKVESHEPFPPGSLTRYLTADRNKEQLDLLKGCTLEVQK